jgi:hypothetical protein
MAEWSNSSASFDFEIKPPEALTSFIEQFNSFVETLVSILDIALQALQFAKAWLLAELDPISAIVELIISEIEDFINELLNAGFYITGDWSIYTPTFENFAGGFQSFEGRMITRLTDTTDPTRPDIPETQNAYAFIAYSALDFAEVHRLLAFFYQFVRLFKINLPEKPSALRVPTNITSEFVNPDDPSVNFSEAFIQQSISGGVNLDAQQLSQGVRISWNLPDPDYKYLGFYAPPPGGFLISVSTKREPMKLIYDKPRLNSQTEQSSSGKKQVRDSGQVLDLNDNPILIYGGKDELTVDRSVNYNDSMEESGVVKDGSSRVFGSFNATDQVPIALDQLEFDGKPIYQKFFYFSTASIVTGADDIENGFDSVAEGFVTVTKGMVNLFELLGPRFPIFFTENNYAVTLRKEDLPYDIDFEIGDNGKVSPIADTINQPDTFYVRVFSVSSNIGAENGYSYLLNDTFSGSPGQPFRLDIEKKIFDGNEILVAKEDRSDPSTPATITFPAAFGFESLGYLTTALIVVILSRSDLPVSSSGTFEVGKAGQATGLEKFGFFVANALGVKTSENYFEETVDEKIDIITFRNFIFNSAFKLAKEIHSLFQNLTPLTDEIRFNCSILLEWLWSDSPFLEQAISSSTYEFPATTIIGSMQSGYTLTGVCKNPFESDIEITGAKAPLYGISPGYLKRSDGLASVNGIPVLKIRSYSDRNDQKLLCIRNLFPPEIYKAAYYILTLMSGPVDRPTQDGYWYSLRFSQLIPQVGQFFDIILQWARTFNKGIASVIDAIEQYIDFLEARLLELQSLLKTLDILLGSTFKFTIPRFAYLWLKVKGTTGIVNEFLSSESKPSENEPDPASVYAGGIAVVLRGAPQKLIDLIEAWRSE